MTETHGPEQDSEQNDSLSTPVSEDNERNTELSPASENSAASETQQSSPHNVASSDEGLPTPEETLGVENKADASETGSLIASDAPLAPLPDSPVASTEETHIAGAPAGDLVDAADPSVEALAVSAPEEPLAESFEALGLPETLLRAVHAMGWTKPSPVQAKSYRPFTEKRDVLVQSHTGSGKTGAFCLPWIAAQFVDAPAKQTGVQFLAVVPTRELAKQVSDEFRNVAKGHKIHVEAIYGGAAIVPQLEALKKGVHVVVGTPGRLLDHLRRRSLDLRNVKTVVLDECDEMLSMGFLEDIRSILDHCPKERQTGLFSATLPPDILRISRRYLQDPVSIELSGDQIAAREIKHVYYSVTSSVKTRDLLDVLMIEDPPTAIIFCNTREETRMIASILQREGHAAEALSSDLTQAAREEVLRAMREHRLRYLVATDIAARGIDISHITHVINYSFPPTAESYVHRTGRTGRAGRAGVAVSLVAAQEIGDFYLLKKQYSDLEISERLMPSAEELNSLRREEKIDKLSHDLSKPVSPEWVQLARYLRDDPRGERIVAYLLYEATRRKPARAVTTENDERSETSSTARRSDADESRFSSRDTGRPRDARGRSRDRHGERSRPPGNRDVAGSQDETHDSRAVESAESERSDGRIPRRERVARMRRERETGRRDRRDREQRASRSEQIALDHESDHAIESNPMDAPVASGSDDALSSERDSQHRRRRNRREQGRAATEVELSEAAEAVSPQPANEVDDTVERDLDATREAAESGSAEFGDEDSGGHRRKRRRRRRRGRSSDEQLDAQSGEAEQTPTTTEAEPEVIAASTDASTSTESAEAKRRRRRRRRRGDTDSREQTSTDSAVAHEGEDPRISQEQIIIDIDEQELEVVRTEFGDIDELDDLTVKGRRRAFLDELQSGDDVLLEDLSAQDAGDDDDGDEDDDEDDDDTASGKENTHGDVSERRANAPANDSESDESLASDEDADRSRGKRRRRRRRKRTERPALPEITAPPHKDFWEVWSDKFSAKDFAELAAEDEMVLKQEDEEKEQARAAAAKEREDARRERTSRRTTDRERGSALKAPQSPTSPSAFPIQSQSEVLDDFIRVSLNIGRQQGCKSATIRRLLEDTCGLQRRAVRDLTVRTENTLFQLSESEFERVSGLLASQVVEDTSLVLERAVDEDGDPENPLRVDIDPQTIVATLAAGHDKKAPDSPSLDLPSETPPSDADLGVLEHDAIADADSDVEIDESDVEAESVDSPEQSESESSSADTAEASTTPRKTGSKKRVTRKKKSVKKVSKKKVSANEGAKKKSAKTKTRTRAKKSSSASADRDAQVAGE